MDNKKNKLSELAKKSGTKYAATRISLIYLIISLIWISGSGQLALSISSATQIPLHTIELIKGALFVIVTYLLLHVLIQRSINRILKREAKIEKLNRIYVVLSTINAEILRTSDKQNLLDQACQIAVEHGGYKAVCIRLVNDETKLLEIVAIGGDVKHITFPPAIALADTQALAQEPSGIVIKENRAVVINDISEETISEQWSLKSREYGINSCAAFPLLVNNKNAGSFTFYSGEANTFDDDEIRLLSELAADTSIGLTQIVNEQQLLYVTYHDVVTGLPNRNLLIDRFRQTVSGYGYRTNRITAVMAISIENYRKIVDVFGVFVGDAVLYQFALLLRDSVRTGDTIAKVDSHDFVVLLTDIANTSDLTAVTRKVISNLPQVITENSIDIVLHCRAGIAVHPRDGNEPDELLRHAGIALTAARDYDEPYKYYSKTLEDQSTNEHAIETELQSAVKNNELRLAYQPIVSITDKTVIGFESLLRWKNPRLGEMPPGQFITIAENTGLIISVGYWVFEQAVKQLKEWSGNGVTNTYISVNVSSFQLRQSGMAGRFIETLKQYDLGSSGNRIVLEITESALIENPEVVIPELHLLKSEGMDIYIDDFGTGYSSLSYLRRFPVNALKIDREFIIGLTKGNDATALVKGIIGMANGIGIRVVAEGVETEEQYTILSELGCDMGQGYYFSKPKELSEIKFTH